MEEMKEADKKKKPSFEQGSVKGGMQQSLSRKRWDKVLKILFNIIHSKNNFVFMHKLKSDLWEYLCWLKKT